MARVLGPVAPRAVALAGLCALGPACAPPRHPRLARASLDACANGRGQCGEAWYAWCAGPAVPPDARRRPDPERPCELRSDDGTRFALGAGARGPLVAFVCT